MFVFVLAETLGAQQPSLIGVGGVGAAERPHLQTQQDLGGKTQTHQTQRVFQVSHLVKLHLLRLKNFDRVRLFQQ